MGIKIKAKVTKKGNLKIDELAQTLLDLNPNDEVVVTIKSKESVGGYQAAVCYTDASILIQHGNS